MIVWWPRHGWYQRTASYDNGQWRLTGPMYWSATKGEFRPVGSGVVDRRVSVAVVPLVNVATKMHTLLYPFEDDSDRRDPYRLVWVIEGDERGR